MFSKKRLIFVVLLLLVCLFMATIGLNTVTKEAGKAAHEVSEQVRLATANAETKFVMVGKFHIPVIHRNSVDSHLTIMITLGVAGDGGKELIREKRRQLKDAFLHDLSAAAYWPDIKSGYHLPISALKKRLLALSRDIMGPDIVREVLVTSMIERKL